MTKIKSLFISLVLTLGVSTAIAGSHGSTHDLVKERGKLMCGSNTGLAGFGAPNDAGVWEGIDVDVCRAVAAAVLVMLLKLNMYLQHQKYVSQFFSQVKLICYQEILHGLYQETLILV